MGFEFCRFHFEFEHGFIGWRLLSWCCSGVVLLGVEN